MGWSCGVVADWGMLGWGVDVWRGMTGSGGGEGNGGTREVLTDEEVL